MESSILSDVCDLGGVGSTDQDSSSSGREKLTPLEQYEQKVSEWRSGPWAEGRFWRLGFLSFRKELARDMDLVLLGWEVPV